MNKQEGKTVPKHRKGQGETASGKNTKPPAKSPPDSHSPLPSAVSDSNSTHSSESDSHAPHPSESGSKEDENVVLCGPISDEDLAAIKKGAKLPPHLLSNGILHTHPHPSPSSSSSSKSTSSTSTMWFQRKTSAPPLVYKAELNILWWVVMGVGLLVRFWRLDFPCYVIFDEVHFGKFASYYLQRMFFFDVHPPLGKMLFALVGYISGFDGTFLFPSIGLEIPPSVPYVMMRGVSALSGSLLIACIYEIMTELGFSHRSAALAALFTIFDNSLVIQSRVIMLDSLLIFFTYASILAYLKFYRYRSHPFSPSWHCSLAITGVFLGCLLGIKYTGLLGLACVGLLALCDLWQLIGNHTLTTFILFQHALLRGVYLLGIPVLMNITLFYIHFLLLSQAGPGNVFVSKAFQNSLEGTIDLSPTTQLSPNATLLRYGSSFSLRSTDFSCWLHSHNHTYPLKYPDGRGSSYQQQITCYDFRDVNNLWAVRKPGSPQDTSIPVDDSPIRNGDMVELVHLGTGKLLNSHDVAAPLSPGMQEVAGYINYSAQFVPHLQWQLEVAGLESKEPLFWEKGKLKLRLLHVRSKQALSSTGKRLPEWGFQQYEVVTDRAVEETHVLWGVDDVHLPNTSRSRRNRSKEMQKEEKEIKESLARRVHPAGSRSNPANTGGTTLNFWEKYFEIQEHMISAHSSLGDHTFGAPPLNWPLMGKTLPYWLDQKTNAQVTLLGNPVLWWLSTGSIHVFLLLVSLYLMRRHRLYYDLETVEFQQLWRSGSVLLVGWMVHYVPYFLLSRVLFLHHYLPALPFKFMLFAAVCEHAHTMVQRWPNMTFVLTPVYYFILSMFLVAIVASYLIFAPFTYGYPALSQDEIAWRLWVDTWDLLHRQ